MLDELPPDIEMDTLLAWMVGDDRQLRLQAIDAISRVGDERALEAMRERLRLVSREHQALIIAIGTLRWRLSGSEQSGLDQHQAAGSGKLGEPLAK